ncbi:heterokaryon incompatibility protein-domain-containing protein [Geopyxis carbonaria]|nr:heterokaryon incompatibility protein-domain-containing protein [Geopyxis carbonaria]
MSHWFLRPTPNPPVRLSAGSSAPPPPRPAPPSFLLPSPTPDPTLCPLCTTLDFRAILTHGLTHDGTYIPLGAFPALRARASQCAFCRLLTTAVIRGWTAFVPDWEADVEGVAAAQCVLACSTVSLAPEGTAKELRVRVHPLPPAVAREKVRTGRVELSVVRVLAEDAGVWGLDGAFHGRVVPRAVVGRERMLEWMQVCEEFHQDYCGKEVAENMKRVPKQLRVIDVVEMRLIPAVGLRYVALSYVWGQVVDVDRYKTTKANFEARTKEGGLAQVVFPRTIRDSIALVRLLGERFLWVDAVCIIQDDGEDQAAQIANMNIVYGASCLTIAAAGGADAETGLPRAHEDSLRDIVQHIETVRGVRMVLPLRTLSEALPNTTWSTRGWTYQERLLPSRRLYFTPEQAYFECRRCSWSEDLLAEERTSDTSSAQAAASGGNQLRKTSRRGGWDDGTLFLQGYNSKVQEYTRRNVSFDSDALNAFMGVAAVLSESYGDHIKLLYGLPEAHIESALLWQPRMNITRRYAEDRGVFLPSWSWAGWKGEVTYSNRSLWMSIGPSYGTHAASVVPEWFLHGAPGTPPERLNVKFEKWWSRDPAQKPVPSPPPCPKEISAHRESDSIHPGVLEFCTTTAKFSARVGSEHGEPCYCYSDGKQPPSQAAYIHMLVDPEGHACGSFFLDIKTLNAINIVNERCDFIALARSGSTTTCPGYNEKVYEKAEYCLIDVMLIEWRGTIAYRLGLGKIHEDAWVNSQPEWRRIFLG